ncbi:MAG: CotH kinase family protein [Chthoniobacteraceae bacterium]
MAVTSLGANKEFYRWYWLSENARDNDDYTGLINVVTAVGQPGGTAAFNTQTAQYIDINTWLRANVPTALFGVNDNYLGPFGGQHNALFYFPPGGKAVLFPWDMDFLN